MVIVNSVRSYISVDNNSMEIIATPVGVAQDLSALVSRLLLQASRRRNSKIFFTLIFLGRKEKP